MEQWILVFLIIIVAGLNWGIQRINAKKAAEKMARQGSSPRMPRPQVSQCPELHSESPTSFLSTQASTAPIQPESPAIVHPEHLEAELLEALGWSPSSSAATALSHLSDAPLQPAAFVEEPSHDPAVQLREEFQESPLLPLRKTEKFPQVLLSMKKHSDLDQLKEKDLLRPTANIKVRHCDDLPMPEKHGASPGSPLQRLLNSSEQRRWILLAQVLLEPPRSCSQSFHFERLDGTFEK